MRQAESTLTSLKQFRMQAESARCGDEESRLREGLKNTKQKNSDLLLHLHRLAPRVDVSFKAARSAASFQGRPVWSSTCPKTQLSSSSSSAAVVRASGVTWREEHKLTNQEARRRRYQTPDLPQRRCAASCTLKCEDGF